MAHLLEFVGLNLRGVRKILKKFAKNVDPTPPAPGFLSLEIAHPHDPNWKLLQVHTQGAYIQYPGSGGIRIRLRAYLRMLLYECVGFADRQSGRFGWERGA